MKHNLWKPSGSVHSVGAVSTEYLYTCFVYASHANNSAMEDTQFMPRAMAASCKTVNESLKPFLFTVIFTAHLHQWPQALTNCTPDPSNVPLRISWTAHGQKLQSGMPWTSSLRKNDSAPYPDDKMHKIDTTTTQKGQHITHQFHFQAGGCRRQPHLTLVFCVNFIFSVFCYGYKFAFVEFDIVLQYYAKRLAGKTVSKMTYFVSGGM